MNTDKFNRLLITFLANEYCLFDPNHPLYNNINERHQAYLRIGNQLRECGASEAQVNRVNDRYQALKRRFLSEHTKVQRGKISNWPYYVELEKLLSNLAERSYQDSFERSANLSQPPDFDLNAEPVCNLMATSSYTDSNKKRKPDNETSPPSKNQTDFSGIFNYLALKLGEMNEQTQKQTIEKLLKVVHNPSISLVNDRQQLSNSGPWPVPPDTNFCT